MSGERTWELFRRGRAAARAALRSLDRPGRADRAVPPAGAGRRGRPGHGRGPGRAVRRRRGPGDDGPPRGQGGDGPRGRPAGADRRLRADAGRQRRALHHVRRPGPGAGGGAGRHRRQWRAAPPSTRTSGSRVWPRRARHRRTRSPARFPNSVTAIALLWLAARRDWLRAEWARHDRAAVPRRRLPAAGASDRGLRPDRTASCWTARRSTPAPAASPATAARLDWDGGELAGDRGAQGRGRRDPARRRADGAAAAARHAVRRRDRLAAAASR